MTKQSKTQVPESSHTNEVGDAPPPAQPPKKIEIRQNYPFKPVIGETQRTYVYADGKNLPITNVLYISEAQDGSHRLLTRDNLAQGIRVSAGWLYILYQGEAGKPYTFAE